MSRAFVRPSSYKLAFFFILGFLIYLHFAFHDIWPFFITPLLWSALLTLSYPSHPCPCLWQVRYWRNLEDGERAAQRVLVPIKENHTTLEGLKPNSGYLIEVRSYNSAGLGPPSEHILIHTKKPRMFCHFHIKQQLLLWKQHCTVPAAYELLALHFCFRLFYQLPVDRQK